MAPAWLIAASLLAAAAYRLLFPDLVPLVHAASALGMAGVAAAYRRKNRRFDDLVAVAWCLLMSAALEHLIGESFAHLMLRGKRWLAWGAACFAVGLAISLLKGGQFRRLFRWLRRLHVATEHAPERGEPMG